MWRIYFLERSVSWRKTTTTKKPRKSSVYFLVSLWLSLSACVHLETSFLTASKFLSFTFWIDIRLKSSGSFELRHRLFSWVRGIHSFVRNTEEDVPIVFSSAASALGWGWDLYSPSVSSHPYATHGTFDIHEVLRSQALTDWLLAGKYKILLLSPAKHSSCWAWRSYLGFSDSQWFY